MSMGHKQCSTNVYDCTFPFVNKSENLTTCMAGARKPSLVMESPPPTIPEHNLPTGRGGTWITVSRV